MARKANQPPPPQPPLALARPRSEVEQRLQERIALGKELQARSIQSHPDMEAYQAEAIKWDDYNEELLKRMFTNDTISKEYSQIFIGVMSSDPGRILQTRRDNVDRSIRTLESIQGKLELYPGGPTEQSESARTVLPSRDLSKVFVVHGHDGEARQTVARFIEKLGFEAVILHERPNKGRTIITKFREESAGVGFAVVLMTPDDVGGKALGHTTGPVQPRARQNVVFELGFFIGALGPEHVAALVKGDIERPSDFEGVVYISLDDGSWKADLARELDAAGYDVDWNKAMRA